METAAVAEEVLPEYEGRIVFVDALVDDPRADQVLERYPITGIPTSVFVGQQGETVDTYLGPLSASELRGRLDALLAEER